MSARNSLWLWLRQCGYNAILKCFHWCKGHKVGCVPTLSLPTQNDSHSAPPPAQFFSLPLINSREFPFLIFRVLIFRTGRKVSKKSQKMFRIGLRNEWFYLFIYLIYWGIFSVILILRHKWRHIINSIFIVDTILKNLCFAYLLIYLLKHPQEEFFLSVCLFFFLLFWQNKVLKQTRCAREEDRQKKEFL